jgi:tetratricopeptide (TPR) repeat protein
MAISMRNHRPAGRRWRLAFLALAAVAPSPALAQYIGRAPPPPAPLAPGARETPSASLSRNLRLIAQSPRNFVALMAAGRAALDLGDYQSAVGFFGRAEEVAPNDPGPKAGMGAASAAMNEPSVALTWFGQAQRLGASAAVIGADRGLAHDLLGQQATAQADYRAALSGPDANEARRRLALSLAISRDAKGAMTVLQPLLNMRDPAAQRARAFVLALGGDRVGARIAIDSAMPGSSARIDPFFMVLPSLSPEQKAAAVHLGVFPTAAEMRLVPVQPVRVASNNVAPGAAAPRSVPPVAAPEPRRLPVTPPRPTYVALPPVAATTVAQGGPQVSGPITTSPAPGWSSRGPASVVASESGGTAIATPEPVAPEGATLPASTTAELAAGDRLSGIDKLLAATEEAPPPAPEPKVETADKSVAEKKADSRKAASKKALEAKKIADGKKAAETKKLAEATKAADKKTAEEKREREALGVAGANWVQLAGGSHEDRMATEFKKLAAKSSALRKRGGHVTQGKDYFRLLVGPFDSKSEAQSFVNQLAKDDVDGFSWTRTPSTIKIEKLSPK